MKSKEQINTEVENTFKVLDTIEEVKVNHFFKHKVLQQLENQKEEKQSILSWFSPQLQLATLVVMLWLNVSAVFYVYLNDDVSSSTEIENFAQEYALQSSTNSILN